LQVGMSRFQALSEEEIQSLGLVGAGPLASTEDVSSMAAGAIGVCARTGLIVCLVGSRFLATDPVAPKLLGTVQSRVNNTCKARISKPTIAAAVAIATRISAALGPAVAESRRLYLSSSPQDRLDPLLWAGKPEDIFFCPLCPSTAAAAATFHRHVREKHRDEPIGNKPQGIVAQNITFGKGAASRAIAVKIAPPGVPTPNLTPTKRSAVDRFLARTPAKVPRRDANPADLTQFQRETRIYEDFVESGLTLEVAHALAREEASCAKDRAVAAEAARLYSDAVRNRPGDAVLNCCVYVAEHGSRGKASTRAPQTAETDKRYGNHVAKMILFGLRVM
jgi:hypothetical protein